MPPLLTLADEAAYRLHFERTYCRGVITTHDGIRVYFRKEDFDHAFFESSGRRGENDIFSPVRAERMDWIAAALADPTALCFQGWVYKTKRYDATRRVAVVMGDFVVVIAIGRKKDKTLKATFVTCYRADNSIGKILASPLWTLEDCKNAL
ncbi:hypothetical protein [Magnetospirillum sp. SS-4]|uniref:hypothetical protein n=1 Tax=Magnetospirillum sp. SS-4 TaxID=2681465 RepID=UPI001383F9AB|nr:hypothetical protein [Magnetospirillum sp. SS-4]CAA7619544.1 conserved hypothetical protein [Magnetospirillum sp. SS-4]